MLLLLAGAMADTDLWSAVVGAPNLAGWPIRDLLDMLSDMKDSPALSQALRHRALRL
ncbi:hypothetical protein [Plantactinospora sp. DSM 117369]